MRLHYSNVHPNKLHDEIRAAGINPWPVESKGSEVWLGLPDNTPQTTIDQINAIVSAHDPTPPTVVDPDAELEAAIQGATTLEELKAALLGTVRQARVKGKPISGGQ